MILRHMQVWCLEIVIHVVNLSIKLGHLPIIVGLHRISLHLISLHHLSLHRMQVWRLETVMRVVNLSTIHTMLNL